MAATARRRDRAPARRSRRARRSCSTSTARSRPIVRHADDAHVPEPTRVPLIAVAKRYGLVACVSGRRAATARRIVSLGSITYVGNHGAEMLRGGLDGGRARPRGRRRGRARVRAFAERAVRPTTCARLRVRGEDKDVDRRLPLARRARRGGRRGGGARRRGARRGRGLRHPLGPQGAGGPAAGRAQQGPRASARSSTRRRIDVALYVGDDTTDLDAFAALRALVEEGSSSTRCASACAPTRRRRELEAQADLLVDGPLGVRTLLAALAA